MFAQTDDAALADDVLVGLAEVDALLADLDALLGLDPELIATEGNRPVRPEFFTFSATLNAVFGYADNPLLAPDGAQDASVTGSSFRSVEADAFLLADWRGWSLQSFLYGEYRAYAQEHRIAPQWQALALAELRRPSAFWEPVLTATVVHSRQVYDATDVASRPETETLMIVQPSMKLALEAHTAWGTSTVGLETARAEYDLASESFWAHGLYLGHRVQLPGEVEWEGAASWSRERYDTKTERLPNGTAMQPASLLELDRFAVASDFSRRWPFWGRLETRWSNRAFWADDAGAGYFDRRGVETRLSLNWRRGPFAVDLAGQGRWTDFGHRRITFLGDETLWQRQLGAEIGVSWAWSEHFETRVDASFLELDANDDDLTYRAQSIAIRAGWSF